MIATNESTNCTCGSQLWNISETLISCKVCGRLWGRVNEQWVFDFTSAPPAGELGYDKLYVLSYVDFEGRDYMCSWDGDTETLDVVVTWPGHDLKTHLRSVGLIHRTDGLQPGMKLELIPKDVHWRDYAAYATARGGVYAMGWPL